MGQTEYRVVNVNDPPMSSTPTTSRIVKRERDKLLKQTMTWSLIALGLLLMFLFIILPNAPRLLASIVDGGTVFGQEDTIPPQVPIFNSPPMATNTKQIEVSGFAEAKSQVLLVLNGNQVADLTTSDDAVFKQSIDLQEGENYLQAFSKDAAGNESNLSKEYVISLDTQAPSLAFSETIQDGMQVVGKENKSFTISGLTEQNAKVAINDRFLFARPDGSFSYQIQLNEGENLLKLVITDKANNTFEQELRVNYKL